MNVFFLVSVSSLAFFQQSIGYVLELRMLNLASISVQRDLPRPYEINPAILRPANAQTEAPLTELQKVRS